VRGRVPVEVMLAGDVFVNGEPRERIAVPIKAVATRSSIFLVESGVMSLLRRDDQELREWSALLWSALDVNWGPYVPYLVHLLAGRLQLRELFIGHAPKLPITDSISYPDNPIRKFAILYPV